MYVHDGAVLEAEDAIEFPVSVAEKSRRPFCAVVLRSYLFIYLFILALIYST